MTPDTMDRSLSPIVERLLSFPPEHLSFEYYTEPELQGRGRDTQNFPARIAERNRKRNVLIHGYIQKVVDETVQDGETPDFTSGEYWDKFYHTLADMVTKSSPHPDCFVESLKQQFASFDSLIGRALHDLADASQIHIMLGMLYVDQVVAESGILDEEAFELFRQCRCKDALPLHYEAWGGVERNRMDSQAQCLMDTIGASEYRKLAVLNSLAVNSFGFFERNQLNLPNTQDLMAYCTEDIDGLVSELLEDRKLMEICCETVGEKSPYSEEEMKSAYWRLLCLQCAGDEPTASIAFLETVKAVEKMKIPLESKHSLLYGCIYGGAMHPSRADDNVWKSVFSNFPGDDRMFGSQVLPALR